MACKTKKLKLKKYSRGSTLPKYDGYTTNNNQLPYMQQTSEIFAPQQQYTSLSAYNKYQNEQQYGTGLNTPSATQSSIQNKSTKNNYGADELMGDLGKYTGYLQAATTLTEGIGEGEGGGMTREDTQQFIDELGYTIGGGYYAGGKMADELLFGKDEQGLYGSELEASASYFLTDPAQAVAQAAQTWQEGNEWEAIGELILPGLAGRNYQRDREKEIADEEARQRRLADQARLQEINKDVVNYRPVFKYGGKLRKYQNGGNFDNPEKLQSLAPVAFQPEPTGYMYGNKGLQPYYKERDIRVPGYKDPKGNVIIPRHKRDMMGYIEHPELKKSVKLYNTELTPIKSTAKTTVAKGEIRPLSPTTSQYRASDVLNVPIEEVRANPDFYYGKLIQESDGYFTRRVTKNNEDALLETIPTSRYKTEGNKLQFKNYGGNLDYMNPSNASRPIVFKYGGQTHNGPDEGIEVDSTGIPSIMSGKAPVALTEKNEVAFKGPDMESAYIFSDKIRYKK